MQTVGSVPMQASVEALLRLGGSDRASTQSRPDQPDAINWLVAENQQLRKQLMDANMYIMQLQMHIQRLQGAFTSLGANGSGAMISLPQTALLQQQQAPHSAPAPAPTYSSMLLSSMQSPATAVDPATAAAAAAATEAARFAKLNAAGGAPTGMAAALRAPISTAVTRAATQGIDTKSGGRLASADSTDADADADEDEDLTDSDEEVSDSARLEAAQHLLFVAEKGSGDDGANTSQPRFKSRGRMDPDERQRVEKFISMVKTGQIVVAQGDLSRAMQEYVNKYRNKQYFEKLVARRLLNVSLLPFLAPRQRKRRRNPDTGLEE